STFYEVKNRNTKGPRNITNPRKTMKRHIMAPLLLLSIAGLALAHESEKHILGKVTAISDNSITVETATKDPQKIAVVITTQTKFLRSGSQASLKDLRVGERVVIDAKENGKKLEATLVSFGKPNQAAKHH